MSFMLGSNIHIANMSMSGSGVVIPPWTNHSDDLMQQDDTLIASYKMSQDSLTVDTRGTNTLVDINSVLVSANGVSGYCGEWDRTDRLLYRTGTMTDFTFGSGNFLMSIWCNCDDVALSGGQNSISMMDGSSASNRPIAIEQRELGKIVVYLNSASTEILRSPNVVISNGTWQHVAVGRVGTTFVLYVDGLAVDSAISGDALQTPTYFGLGSFWVNPPDSGVNVYDGRLDECNIWKAPTFADQDAMDTFVALLADDAFYTGV